jgi:hypothetical protein
MNELLNERNKGQIELAPDKGFFRRIGSMVFCTDALCIRTID